MNLPLKSSINSTLRISLICACFAVVWIWLSDRAVSWLFPDPTDQILLQSVKGSAFVVVTSLLLYLLIRRDARAREALTSKIELEAERLTHIMAVNPAVIYSLIAAPQAQGGFVVNFVSANVERLTGYTPAQWLTTPGFWLQHLHPEDRLKALRAQQQLRDTGALRHEYRFLHADGSFHWIYDQLTFTPSLSESGAIAVGAWLDLTALKRAQGQVQLTAQVFESSRAGIIIIDADNCMLSVNRAFTEITGYT